MPRATVTKVRPASDLLRPVERTTLALYVCSNIISYAFLLVALALSVILVVDAVNNPNAAAVKIAWQYLALFGGTGGLGGYLWHLRNDERKFLLVQELLNQAQSLPDSKQKEKAILDCITVLVKKAAAAGR